MYSPNFLYEHIFNNKKIANRDQYFDPKKRVYIRYYSQALSRDLVTSFDRDREFVYKQRMGVGIENPN